MADDRTTFRTAKLFVVKLVLRPPDVSPPFNLAEAHGRIDLEFTSKVVSRKPFGVRLIVMTVTGQRALISNDWYTLHGTALPSCDSNTLIELQPAFKRPSRESLRNADADESCHA